MVTLEPKQASVGRVLMSTGVGVYGRIRNGEGFPTLHASGWENWQQSQTFLDLGYTVDVIDFTNTRSRQAKLPSSKYGIRNCPSLIHVTHSEQDHLMERTRDPRISGIRHVALSIGSDKRHYDQVLTGFAMLARQGLIKLRYSMEGTGVLANVDGRRIYYDPSDGGAVDKEVLSTCDLYFKRSYYPPYLTDVSEAYKVQPLGLYYSVCPDFTDWHAVTRNLHFAKSIPEMAIAVTRPFSRGIRRYMSVKTLQAPPSPHEPKVLFLCKAFVPDDQHGHGWPTRTELTEFRAECIKALRSAFGPNCIAGFVPDSECRRKYTSLLANVKTDRKSYLSLLREFPAICVATTGLHGSIGSKLAEYVAFSKAIVTERLNYQVPEFHENMHYLQFSTPEECVESCRRLAEDEAACMRMRTANQVYFETFLRPDKLVQRTLDFSPVGPAYSQTGRRLSRPHLTAAKGPSQLAQHTIVRPPG
ncbi:MAG TPA: hypothetical protein VMR74_08920 [Gammaproteobacteria bacterium]|nr:hypothetical protein [Gammaproteobacteria bacterium]